MHEEKTVQRFIELRAQNRSYAQLTTELGVCRRTLIRWSCKHQFEIQNLRAVEMEALAEKWLASVTDRVNALGEQLHKVEAEIATRDVKDLTTSQLYLLARTLRRQIEQATGTVQFITPVADIPSGEYHDQVQDWPGRFAAQFLVLIIIVILILITCTHALAARRSSVAQPSRLRVHAASRHTAKAVVVPFQHVGISAFSPRFLISALALRPVVSWSRGLWSVVRGPVVLWSCYNPPLVT